MIKITEDPRNKKTLLKIKRSRKDFKKGIREGFFELGAKNKQDAKRAITKGPKTGRVYRIRGRRHRASAAGQAPANLSGALRRSVDMEIKGSDSMEFGYKDTAEYGKFLEEGTVNMAKRPNIVTTVRKNQKDAKIMMRRNINKNLKK